MTRAAPVELSFTATPSSGEVPALLLVPEAARCLLVLAHGAGAGMLHPFMEAVSSRLADRGVATFRYEFPYMRAGRRRPDPPGLLTATVRSAVASAEGTAPGLPLLAGGKSMGGRMSSLASSEDPLPNVLGLVFLGFPLHPAGRPASERAVHLGRVATPMLFLQGTRDSLADLGLLEPVCRSLGARATLYVVEGADHSFRVLARSGRTNEQVLDELADAVSSWIGRILPASLETRRR